MEIKIVPSDKHGLAKGVNISGLFGLAIGLAVFLGAGVSLFPLIRDNLANLSATGLPLAGIFSGTGALMIAIMGGAAYGIYRAVWHGR
jgi:hypothetical protein